MVSSVDPSAASTQATKGGRVMIRCRWLFACAIPALSPVLEASDEKDVRAADVGAKKEVSEPGVLALFSWGDSDGDGRLELVTVSETGELKLLANAGDGRYEDVSARTGLSGINDAALALWGDYDRDGRLDLFVGAKSGASHLFHNEGGSFVDMSAASGLAFTGAVRSAQWFDADGDARLDLFVITAGESALFRGLEGGFFERAELSPSTQGNGPAAGAVSTGPDQPREADGEDATRQSSPAPELPDATEIARLGGSRGPRGSPGGRIAITPTITEVAP